MSDSEEDESSPKDSKCWNCRYGMSLHEKDVQSFFQPTMVEGDVFNGKGEEPGVTEVAFPTNKVRSVCFWRPSNTQALAPVVFSQVTECSRFEKNQ